MMSIATFGPSLLLITGARCAALWSAAWTSLDYKGLHAGNVAQSTAGLWHGNMCCECSSCQQLRLARPGGFWQVLVACVSSCNWRRRRRPSLACVGREVEVSVQHCAKLVFYLSTWGKFVTNERTLSPPGRAAGGYKSKCAAERSSLNN